MPTFHQTLLLGTERLGGAPALPHPSLADAWSSSNWSGAPESAMLDATALVSTARCAGFRAGALPASAATVAPATPETRRPAPPAAVALLKQLFEGELRPLLGEWLELCATAGCVVPPFHLPRLFRDVLRAERQAFAAVAGNRGAWLAAQSSEWSWLANPDETPSVELWETGTPAQRLACLAALRRSDPALARACLEKTLVDETPDFRVAALAALVTGLSMDDEVVLTRCLDDRRRETRHQAQQLLARLPTSGFAQRNVARAESILALKRSFLSKQLELSLPEAFDPAWKTDGIEQKPPTGIGEKTFWVRQILSLVPVGHWMRKFSLTPSELIKSAQKTEWAEVLIDSWVRALPIADEPGMASALFEPVLVTAKNPPVGTNAGEMVAVLFAACSEAERWELTADFGGDRSLAWWCVPHLGQAPSTSDARTVLRHLVPELLAGTAPGGTPSAVAAARAFPAGLRDEAARLLERQNGLSKPAEGFLHALEVRAAMHAAFGVSV